MRSRMALVCILLVLVVATPSAAQDNTEGDAAAEAALPNFPGRIAYVGADFNIYSLNGTTGSRDAITDDAGLTGDTVQVYQWPTWATDGRLAYFRVEVTRRGLVVGTEVFVSPDGAEPGTTIYSGEQEAFTYAYWSPQNCGEANCRDLAVLLSGGPNGFGVELVRDRESEPSATRAGNGAPFYYSWSPDGTRMLFQRNNRQIEVFDVATNEVTQTLDQPAGLFQAPAWSPVDDRLLFGALAEGRQRTDLIIVAGSDVQTLASDLEGLVAFAWSPDGNHVAYTVNYGPLFILDAVTGETVARAPVTGVYAFFWSPDSTRLAYVTLATPPGSFSAFESRGGVQASLWQEESGLAWSVLEVGTGANRRLSSFLPTRDMLYLLSFFDQFGQSHRVWSPDSRHLVYSEITDQGDSVITLLDATTPGTLPLTIAEGTVAVWSFE